MSYPNNANYWLPPVVTTPSSLQITSITQSNPMVMNTTFDPVNMANTYAPGMLVRLFIPWSYGMWQANGLQGKVLDISGNTFTLGIDSTLFDPFVPPSSQLAQQPATLAPAGSKNTQINNFNLTNLPFRSLNNNGN